MASVQSAGYVVPGHCNNVNCTVLQGHSEQLWLTVLQYYGHFTQTKALKCQTLTQWYNSTCTAMEIVVGISLCLHVKPPAWFYLQT